MHEAHQHLQQERRRINQEQRRIDQERERLNSERERERLRRQQQRQSRFEQRRRQRNEQPQNNPVRHRSPPRYDDRHFHEMMNRDPLEEPMDDMYNQPLIEIYNYETMNPQARQEAWGSRTSSRDARSIRNLNILPFNRIAWRHTPWPKNHSFNVIDMNKI